MLVSGTLGNTSALKQDVQNTVASPTQVVASVSSNTTKDDSVASQSASSPKQNQKASNNLGVEEAVREYFADIPLMAEVSKCESRYRQFETSGSVFRGKVNTNDVGALQINETYHLKRAQKLGYDIYTLQGNMAYARLLYQEQGPQPWSSSYPCWGKSSLASSYKQKTRTPIVSTVPTAPVVTTSVADDAVATKVSTTTEPIVTSMNSVMGTPVSGIIPATNPVSVLAER